jgi:copper transport protein
VVARWRGLPVALALVALVTLAGGVRDAVAHATLLSVDPAPGTTLAHAPDIVVLHFDEPVTPIAARVLDAGGRPVSRDDAVSVAGHDLVVPIADRSVRGHLTVSYRVTSVDAHVVAGSFGLDVGAPAHPDAAAGPVVTTTPSPWLVGARALLYASVLLAIGTVLFRTLVAPPAASARDRMRLRGIAAAGVLGAVVHIFATAAAAVPGAPFDIAGVHAALRTSLGPALCVVVAGLAAALGVPRMRPDTQVPVALAASVAMACGLAMTGHAAGLDGGIAMRAVVGAHVIAAGFWVGALPALADELQRQRADVASIVARFSRVAFAAVLVLVVAGATLALVQVGSLDALVSSEYGRWLIVKLVLVGVLLAVALRNRTVLTPRVASAAGSRALRRAIGAELALMAAIVLVTAGLGDAVPPRAGKAVAETGLRVESRDARTGAALEMVVVPARSGANVVTTRLRDRDGRSLQPLAVHFAAEQPDAGIEPSHVAAEALGDGRHRAVLDLAVRGTWRVRVLVTVSDFEQVTFTVGIPIP